MESKNPSDAPGDERAKDALDEPSPDARPERKPPVPPRVRRLHPDDADVATTLGPGPDPRRQEGEEEPPSPTPSGETVLQHTLDEAKPSSKAKKVGPFEPTIPDQEAKTVPAEARKGDRTPAASFLRRHLGDKEGSAGGAPGSPDARFSDPVSRDRYIHNEEIARGGMGAILRIADNDLRRNVAMKLILEREDPDLAERFVEEAQITGQLEHPNIVPVHELGIQPDGRVYFTMKLVKGEALHQILERLASGDPETVEAYPLTRLLRIFLKVLDAIGFAHSRGVIHRDLKPENVMVGSFGEVLVMDWGLAKARGREETLPEGEVETDRSVKDKALTLAGSVMGTPSYMPPEQASGHLEEIDERSDIFALGGILYAMLVHEAPYAGKDVREIVEKAVRCRVVPPRRRFPRKNVPPELESICMKALSPKPWQRYESADRMSREIQAFIDRRLVSAHRYGSWARIIRFIQRNPTTSIAVGVAAFMLVISSAVVGVVASQMQAARARARAEEAQRREADTRRREAEVGKDAAENRASVAEAALQKGRLVSSLLRSAYVEIGGVAAAMKRLRRNRDPGVDREIQTRALWDRVRRFEETVREDPSSQATWLAIQGWLHWTVGNREEAHTTLRAARERDPDVVYGWLFDAMIWFTLYMHRGIFPAYTLTPTDLEWHAVPEESVEQRGFREHFEKLVGEARKVKVWGESSSDEFSEALKGFKAYHAGEYGTADLGFGRALAIPEMVWIADELRFARAKARLLNRDVGGAVEDLDRAIASDTLGGFPLHYKAQAMQVKGYLEQYAGRDPLSLWEEAVRLYDEVERKYPGQHVLHGHRGLVYNAMARVLLRQDRDPLPYFQKAIKDFSAGVQTRLGHAAKFNAAASASNRAIAYTELAAFVANRGGDPREKLQLALDDYLLALHIYPPLQNGIPRFHEGLQRYCRSLSIHGENSSAFLEAFLRKRREALVRNPDRLDPAFDRALILSFLGRHEEAARSFERILKSTRQNPRLLTFLQKSREALRRPHWEQRMNQAKVMGRIGDYEAARLILEKAVGAMTSAGIDRDEKRQGVLVDALIELAGLHAQASVGRTTLKRDPPPVSPKEAEAHRVAALGYLKRAKALDENIRETLRTRANFAPLRNLPAFKAILGK
ncbi:MAG: serine/threonine-protein kinase [Planctomycetota bacterium]